MMYIQEDALRCLIFATVVYRGYGFVMGRVGAPFLKYHFAPLSERARH